LQTALATFTTCLARRRAERDPADPPDYHEAYTLRRLGQIYALLGDPAAALDAFVEAAVISKGVGHLRLLDEIRIDSELFRFSNSP
jgi:hypothetical protein